MTNFTENIIYIENLLTNHKIWIEIATALGALIFGIWQIIINRRLKSLQDYVSVSAVPGDNGVIKLLNTGKTNLYLWGFDMASKETRFKKPRLITAGTNDSSYFWINPPTPGTLVVGAEFEFTLYLEDDFGKKWVSENGGVVKDIDEQKIYKIIIWSHKTFKSSWKF